MKASSSSRHPSHAQRGSVLLFSLITLTILMISAVALVRSFNASLFNAGNLSFKRDLTNQAEVVWPIVYARMTAANGALATPAARAVSNKDYNYSAQTLLASSATSKGIPDALLDDSSGNAQFYQVARLANDIDAGQGVTIRYVVDRLCNSSGLEGSAGPTPGVIVTCTPADGGNTSGGDAKSLVQPAPPAAGLVYRLSIRVTGPRKTMSFFQTTFSL